MQGWLASMLGTSIGLLLTIVAAMVVLADPPLVNFAAIQQQFMQVFLAPQAVPSAPEPVAAAPPPAPAAARPLQPRLPAPLAPDPPSLLAPTPAAGPDGLAGLLRRPPPGWGTGTGFFVNSRGTILTAEHVVAGCSGVRVMSAHMRPENATVVAIDVQNDVAVLEVAGLAAPAWLAVGSPSGEVRNLFVLGFPQGSLPDVPNEAWTGLVNRSFPANIPMPTDPRDLVWLRHQELGPGYSGGPVVDPNTGRVMGMIRAGMDSTKLSNLYGVSTNHLALGPGVNPMQAMLARWTVREGVVPAGLRDENAVDAARKATVRVVCTK